MVDVHAQPLTLQQPGGHILDVAHEPVVGQGVDVQNNPGGLLHQVHALPDDARRPHGLGDLHGLQGGVDVEGDVAQFVVAEPEAGLFPNQVPAPAGHLKLLGEEGLDVRSQGVADGGVFLDALGGKGDVVGHGDENAGVHLAEGILGVQNDGVCDIQIERIDAFDQIPGVAPVALLGELIHRGIGRKFHPLTRLAAEANALAHHQVFQVVLLIEGQNRIMVENFCDPVHTLTLLYR